MQNIQMNIGTFAKACGITKATLMHYEDIGLFKPETVLKNGYRYYGENQIYRIEAITLLRSMDMSLSEIIDYLDNNSKEENLNILKSNIRKIEDKIFRLEQIERLLHATINNFEAETTKQIDVPFIEEIKEPIYLYTFPTSQRDGSITKHLPTLRKYLQKCRKQYINSNNSVGEIILHKDIMNNSFKKTYGCYMLEHKIDDPNCHERPAGTYLSIYYRGHSNDLPTAYRFLKCYAIDHSYSIINCAYEEDFSTVISEHDRNNFILKISLQIEKGTR